MEMTMLIKRCLAYGVKILPYELERVSSKYLSYKIPDDVLGSMSEEQLQKYVRALYLCGEEVSRDWARGVTMLIELGFEEEKVVVGNRSFNSLKYKKIKD